MHRSLKSSLVALLVISMVTALWAVTIVPVKKTCPICGEENDLQTYASWGSYVYQWPSKYQMVFFPHTYSTTHYLCKRCHFTAYMWDWDSVPKEKIEAIRSVLKDVSAPTSFKSYTEIPVSSRMVIEERVYKVLEKDTAFWEDFYRVMGYHYAAEHHPQEAAEARKKSLALAEAQLARPENSGGRKKDLVVAAAMHHYLKQDDMALKQLQEAASLTYTAGADKNNSKGFDQYLSELIKDYQEHIKAGTVPDSDKDQD